MHEPDEVMPEFYAPLENWTVTQGRDIYFTCTVNNLGNYKVINNSRSMNNNKIIPFRGLQCIFGLFVVLILIRSVSQK